MTLDEEMDSVRDLSHAMIASYIEWGLKIQTGKTRLTVYSDVTDFVNFRVEMAE